VTAVSSGVGGADQFLGGLFSGHWGFRSIFLFILIVGIAAIILSIAYLPESTAATPGRMDWAGAAALICVNIGVNRGGSHRWSDPSAAFLLLVALGCFVIFWFVEKHRANPLITIRHLKSRQVWPIVTTTLATLTGVFAAINFTARQVSREDLVSS
jgi:predicted MFS family arabinose efflux permease